MKSYIAREVLERREAFRKCRHVEAYRRSFDGGRAGAARRGDQEIARD